MFAGQPPQHEMAAPQVNMQAPKSAGKSKSKRLSHWQRACKLLYSVSRFAKKISSLSIILIMVAVGTGREGPVGQVIRIMSSIADVSVSLGSAATMVLDSTTGATALATSVLAALSATTLSTIDTTWHGVDLRSISGQRTIGGILMEESYLLNEWLFSEGGMLATRCSSDEVLHFFAATTNQTGILFPAAEGTVDHLQLNGSYWSASCSAHLVASGHTVFQFAYTSVAFEPVWANPLWAWLELDIESERRQFAHLVQSFISQLPIANLTWGALPHTDRFMRELWLLRKLRLWGRAFSIRAASWVEFWASRRGFGTIMCITLAVTLLQCSLCFSPWARQGLLHLLNRLASWRQALWAWARAYGSCWWERTAWAWDYGFSCCFH